MKYTVYTIKVQPIDRDKLNTFINQDNKNPKITFNIAHGLGIIRSPKRAVISTDLVGNDIDNKITFNLYREEIKDTKHIHSMIPERAITFTLAELDQFLMPKITLHEFADDDYMTHHRRYANYLQWMKHFNNEEQ